MSLDPPLPFLQNPLNHRPTTDKLMNPKTHRLPFPDHLPPEAALALFDCLTELVEAVWQLYEPVLLDQILTETNTQTDGRVEPQPDFDDEIPF